MVTGKGREGTEIGGRYRVHQLLGEGAFAAVYQAEHKVTGMRLALKILHPNVSKMKGTLDRFIRETQIVGQLQHPNIARIFDAGLLEDEGTAYAALEFLDGESLGELLERDGPMPPKDLAFVIGDVLRALSAAHKHNVVHRDIKPENIFITRDHDGREIAKVLDFGIAHTEATNSPKLTQAGVLVGSPLYMSPEQVTGDPVTPATDLWAVGLVLYESLTGEVPFNGDSLGDIFNNIMWKKPQPIALLPPGLSEVILKALSKRPTDRFATAEEMSRAIDRVTTVRRPTSLRPSDPTAPKPAPELVPGLVPGPALEAFQSSVTALNLASLHPEPGSPTVPAGPPIAPAVTLNVPSEGFDLDDLISPVKPPGSGLDLDLHFEPTPKAKGRPSDGSISGLDWGPSTLQKPPESPAPARDEPALKPRASAPDVIRVTRPESEVHTMMSSEVIDRTSTRRVASERARAINPWIALLAVTVVTATLLKLSWHSISHALYGHPERGARDALQILELNDPNAQTPPSRTDPQVESQTPMALGEQIHQPLPPGLSREDILRFTDHVQSLAHTDSPRPRTAGFASCTRDSVYLHPGGANGVMRSARAALACERGDLASTTDLDDDQLSDLVAIDRRRSSVLLLGSQRLSVLMRFSLSGAHALVGGLSLDGGEPGALVYVNPDGRHPALVGLGLRRGRVAWRSPEALAVGEPSEFGLAVGPDADGDHRPDVLMGSTFEARRCFELLSGATGRRVWRAPVCFVGIQVQSLSLGVDTSGDGRADAAVSHDGDAVLRLYSGADGTLLRTIHADSVALHFGWPVALVPDLARDGFPDVIVGNSTPGNPTVEVFSSHDGHRVATWDVLGAVTPGRVRVQFADGFAYPGCRSILVASPEHGVSVVATVAPPP